MASDGVPRLDTLNAVVGLLFPARAERKGRSRRRGILVDEHDLTEAQLEATINALSDRCYDRHVDGEVVYCLLRSIDRLAGVDTEELTSELMAHVERRWSALVLQLADKAVNGIYDRARI